MADEKRLDQTTLIYGAVGNANGLGGLNMNGQRLPNSGDPVNLQDLVTLNYANNNYVSNAGNNFLLNTYKDVEVTGTSTIPLVDGLTSGINISYDQNTKQFVIDATAYTGTSTSINTSIYRYTDVRGGSGYPYVGDGIGFIGSLSTQIYYFAADPNTQGGGNSALGVDYQFSGSTSIAGERWYLSITMTGSDFSQRFVLNAITENVGFPTISQVHIQYKYDDLLA